MGHNQRGRRGIAIDPDAFEAFYRRHVEAVTSFLARRVDDPHTVADLVAEVFLASLDSAHTYRPGLGSERGWLYGVARNRLSAERRRAARERRLASRISGRRLLDDDDISRLEDRIDAERHARRAIQAMAALPDTERAVLELVAIDQLSIADAATALGIRQATARVRLHRARQAVRRLPRTPTISVLIRELRDPDRLEADLARLGVHVDISYHTSDLACPDGRFAPSQPLTPEQRAELASRWLVSQGEKTAGELAFKIYPQRIPPGQTPEVRVDVDTANPDLMWVGFGPPPPCQGR